jgi:hypothetical protein
VTFLQAPQRRQALHQARCGATGMDFGHGRFFCPLPPAPPNNGKRPEWGQAEQGRGRAIDFFNAGGQRMCKKPVDHPLCAVANPRGTKRNPSTYKFKNPRVVPFSPRVWSFFPRVCFCHFCPPPVSISLFSLERESREREGAGKLGIHGFFDCLKKHPRVWCGFHGFSGDCFLSKSQYWCGFAWGFRQIHASTGRNAYTSLTKVRND